MRMTAARTEQEEKSQNDILKKLSSYYGDWFGYALNKDEEMTYHSSIEPDNLQYRELGDADGRKDPAEEGLFGMGFMWRESWSKDWFVYGYRGIYEDTPLSFVRGAKRSGHLVRQ